MVSTSLDGKVAIVTGGGSGIGQGVARSMSAAGATVVVVDIDPPTGEAVAQEVGGLFIRADVSSTADTRRVVATTLEHHGALDVLVNNAGITEFRDVLKIDERHWDRIHAVNSRGLFFLLQAAAKEMVSKGGSIINMSSISARGYSMTSSAAYSSSKGSVLSLTRTAALQLAKYNIRVNAICPGITLTPILDEWRQASLEARDQWQRMLDGIPLGRPNTTAHLGALAVFLASPGAETITGQSFTVDGGIMPS